MQTHLQTHLHTDTFIYRHIYIQTHLHADTFIYRHIYMQTHLHTDTFTYILFLSFFVCASTCEDSFFYREIETFSGSRFKTDDKQKKKLFGIATWTPHDWNDIKQQSSIHRKFSCERKVLRCGNLCSAIQLFTRHQS